MKPLIISIFLSATFAFGQTISCGSGFASSGACGVTIGGSGQPFWAGGSTATWPPTLSGSQVILAQTAASHTAISLIYQTQVSTAAFSTTFTFIPNGQYLALVFNNATNSGGNNGPHFSAGAGNEGGFMQAFQNPPVNNVFAMEFDQYNSLTINAETFTYPSVQIYQPAQCPQNLYTDGCEGDKYADYSPIKLSVSPVVMNLTSVVSGCAPDPYCTNTTTGDTYSATATYDGYNFTVSLFDVTAGGSCPGANCFTHTWNGVNIPGIVGSTTAYVGFTQSTSTFVPTAPLYINSWTFTEETPATSHSFTATNYIAAHVPLLAAPSFSPAAGTYTGTQSVALSSSVNSVICYAVGAGSTLPAILPQPNNIGGCNSGTLYTGPISLASTSTVYASAGPTAAALVYPSTMLGVTSTVVAAAYTISAGPPVLAAPAFSPVSGIYAGTQTVSLSAPSGAKICYVVNGTPTAPTAGTCGSGSTQYTTPLTVSSSQSISALSTESGFTNSTTATASYVITLPVAAIPVFSPTPGSYAGPVTVTISSTTSGATIYYTTDGTTPTTASNVYSGGIITSATTTFKAIAVAGGFTNSSVASGTYTLPASASITISVHGTVTVQGTGQHN